MKINVSHNGHEYYAVLDGYDGAPDATGPYSLVGTGITEPDAVADLIEKFDGVCPVCQYEEGRGAADYTEHSQHEGFTW